QMIDAAEHRAEEFAVVGNAANRDAAEIDAVIAALAPDQPRARALADGALIRNCDLERGLDRFGAGVGVKYAVEIARKQRGNARGQLERLGVPHLEGGRVIHFRRLSLDRADDLGVAVPRVAAP